LLTQAKPTLAELLEKNFSYEGRRIVVINGASASWKEPQQLIQLLLNANAIDAVVSIEGFNELAFHFSSKYHYDMAAPMLQTYARANPVLLSTSQEATIIGVHKLFDVIQQYPFVGNSKTVFFVLDLLSRQLLNNGDIRRKNDQYRTTENMFLLPKGISP